MKTPPPPTAADGLRGSATPKRRLKNLLLLFLLSLPLSSCSTILGILGNYDECGYPGCTHEARKGSTYCPQHDYNMQKNNFEHSWENTVRRAREKRP